MGVAKGGQEREGEIATTASPNFASGSNAGEDERWIDFVDSRGLRLSRLYHPSQGRLRDRDALPVPLAFPRATHSGAAPSLAKSAGCFLLAAPSGFPFPLLAAPTCHHLAISTPPSATERPHLLCHARLGWQLQQCSFQSSPFKMSLMVSAIYSEHSQTCSSGLLWFHTAQLSERSPEENSFFSPQKVRNIVEVQLIKKTVSCLIPSDWRGFSAKQRQPVWTLQILKKQKGRGGNWSKLMGVTTVSGEKYHNPTSCSWSTSLPAAEGLALS